jgi:PIN domain-containing protein
VLVSPRPGVNRENLLNDLHRVYHDVGNLRGGSGARNAYERLLDYLNWASDAVTILGNQISGADLDRLVLTRRYGQLLAGAGTLGGSNAEKVVNLLVSLELKERVDAFEAAIETLKQHVRRWSVSDYFIVADSSFYIEHPDKFEVLDLATVVEFYDGPIHLLFPMIVLDELDGLKRTKDQRVKYRAGHTLAVLDRLFKDGKEVARLRDADPEVQRQTGVRRGEVNVEILYDPRGHVRLSIPDDEIVDRAAAIQALVGRDVTLLTYDTSQAMRGRHEGLKVLKLSKPIEADAK